MDWVSVSRLLPEIGVLAVVGYFALRGISLTKEIIDKIEERNTVNQEKLIKAIDRNTKATKSADTYLRERNGRDSEVHKELMLASRENTKAAKDIAPQMQKIAQASVKSIMTAMQNIPEQKVEHQHVDRMTTDIHEEKVVK